ncbi:ABC transporter permease [Chloroflexota bacterium]
MSPSIEGKDVAGGKGGWRDVKVHIIAMKTLRDLLSLKRVLLVTLLGIVPSLILAASWNSAGRPLEADTHLLLRYFVIISFMWIAGFYIAYTITNSGMEFVSGEEESGTLLIMVSKPISRFQFILGKFLALVVAIMLLELIILFGSVVVIWLVAGIDPEILSDLLALVFWVFLYSIIVNILFASITISLGTVLKGRVAMIAITTLVIVIVFGAGTIMRLGWPGIYDNYRLYYVDPGYHLGNIYTDSISHAESGRMTPQTQALTGLFTGKYRTGTEELILTMFLGSGATDPDIGAMPPSLDQTNYVSPAISILLCLVVSGALLWVAKVAIERKEVY